MALMIVLISTTFFLTNLQALYIIKNYYQTDTGSRNLEELESIINPVSVRLHIDYAVFNTLLKIVKKSCDPARMRQFVEYTDSMLIRHTRPELYLGLLQGYASVKDWKGYEKTRAIAHYYYPTDINFSTQAKE